MFFFLVNANAGVIFILEIIALSTIVFITYIYLKQSPARVTLVKIDKCIWYDASRNKIIIKLPFKKSIFLPDELRRTHRPIHLNKKIYEFYDDYVLINKIRISF